MESSKNNGPLCLVEVAKSEHLGETAYLSVIETIVTSTQRMPM